MKVPKNLIVGFSSEKGLMLDLDFVLEKGAKNLAEYLLKRHKLEGYILVKSSPKHYHIIFDKKNISWRTTMKIMFTVYKSTAWAIEQARHGFMTLRVTEKNGTVPEIIMQKGKKENLIKDYLEIFHLFNSEEEK